MESPTKQSISYSNKIIHQGLHTSVKQIKLVLNEKTDGKYHHAICSTNIYNKINSKNRNIRAQMLRRMQQLNVFEHLKNTSLLNMT